MLAVSISVVSSYRLLCLGYGDVYPGPSGKVCEHDLCQVCVNDEMTYHVNYNYCNEISACEIFNTSKIDADPPNLTVSSPAEGGVYESTSILLDVKSNEPCSLYYIDNNYDRGRWTRVCASCREYLNKRRFEEGLNNLTIKCIDRSGNKAEIQRTFRVDSRSPKISRTEPTDGFALGTFKVKFKEENPSELWLNFGNTGDFSSKKVSLDCEEDKRYTVCEVYADLSAYDGEDIQYWFNITDIAGSYDESRIRELKVDFSPPVINSIEIEKDKRTAYFLINITETNFKEIAYIEDNERERRLCNKLEDGICEDKASFKDGGHNVTIMARDEAGNEANRSTYFFIDSKSPKILKSEPRRGFTNGFFEVQFKEENPVSLTLKYGNGTSEKEEDTDLGDCNESMGKQSCSVYADLSEFNGQEITYHFELEDVVGNMEKGSENRLEVDTISPELNNNGSFWSKGIGRYEDYIYFSLNLTEENFGTAEYYNGERWRTICSSLDNNGVCEGRGEFEPGHHALDIQITDKAGNSISERIEFDI